MQPPDFLNKSEGGPFEWEWTELPDVEPVVYNEIAVRMSAITP